MVLIELNEILAGKISSQGERMRFSSYFGNSREFPMLSREKSWFSFASSGIGIIIYIHNLRVVKKLLDIILLLFQYSILQNSTYLV